MLSGRSGSRATGFGVHDGARSHASPCLQLNFDKWPTFTTHDLSTHVPSPDARLPDLLSDTLVRNPCPSPNPVVEAAKFCATYFDF